MPLQRVGTGGWVEVTALGAAPPGRARCKILGAVLVEGFVPNVAFDDLSLLIHEDASSTSGGQIAVLVIMLM